MSLNMPDILITPQTDLVSPESTLVVGVIYSLNTDHARLPAPIYMPHPTHDIVCQLSTSPLPNRSSTHFLEFYFPLSYAKLYYYVWSPASTLLGFSFCTKFNGSHKFYIYTYFFSLFLFWVWGSSVKIFHPLPLSLTYTFFFRATYI